MKYLTGFCCLMMLTLVAVAMVSSTVRAESHPVRAPATYVMNMTGGQEIGAGDADGLATGTISLNEGTGLISWDLKYSDIAAPSAMHIHGPGGSAGSPAGVFIGLGVDTSGGDGTLIGSLAHSPLSDIEDILNDPMDFYLNIHNGDFPGGAVRGQLGVPEPSTLVLAAAALLGLGAAGWRRRRRAA